MKKSLLPCAVAAFLSVPLASATPPLRIMPLGDSITYGSSVAGGLPPATLHRAHQSRLQRGLRRLQHRQLRSRPRYGN